MGRAVSLALGAWLSAVVFLGGCRGDGIGAVRRPVYPPEVLRENPFVRAEVFLIAGPDDTRVIHRLLDDVFNARAAPESARGRDGENTHHWFVAYFGHLGTWPSKIPSRRLERRGNRLTMVFERDRSGFTSADSAPYLFVYRMDRLAPGEYALELRERGRTEPDFRRLQRAP